MPTHHHQSAVQTSKHRDNEFSNLLMVTKSEQTSPATLNMYKNWRNNNKRNKESHGGSRSNRDLQSITSREVIQSSQKGVGARSLLVWKANEKDQADD